MRALVFQSRDEVSRIFQNLGPIGSPGQLGRGGDNAVDLCRVERAVNHQGFRDRPYRRAVFDDQRLGLGKPERQAAVRRSDSAAPWSPDLRPATAPGLR
jgi:hypothetical protein